MHIKPFDINECKEFITASSKESAVYVGCDSHKTMRGRDPKVVFVTVVIVHKDQCHGAKLFRKIDILPRFRNNKERLMKEVELAIEVATQLMDVVDERIFQVHLDLNPDPKHYSNCAVKEALGWCAGMGLDAVIKPESFAASAAADHFAVKIAN